MGRQLDRIKTEQQNEKATIYSSSKTKYKWSGFAWDIHERMRTAFEMRTWTKVKCSGDRGELVSGPYCEKTYINCLIRTNERQSYS